LKARPEQTQLEDLSDASFLGKLLVLPPNVRLDWKVIARYKHSSLVVCKEEKKFYNIDTWGQCYKTFLSVIYGFFVKSVCPWQAFPALPTNIRLDWKGLPGTNTLAYYENQ
jgi:hypothetical protein